MKVLHVCTAFPLSYPGGITNYVRTLAKSQVAHGVEVHVLARLEDTSNYPPGLTLKPYKPSRVRAFSLEVVDEDPSVAHLVRTIERERYSIVHFHASMDLPLNFLRDFSRLGVPYMVSLHDYFYICPRIFMVDYASNVCREVVVEKCRSCVGRLDQIFFLKRAAARLHVELPRLPSSEAERRLEAMKTFLENADLLLGVSTRTAAIYSHVVPSARMAVEQIGNESAHAVPAIKTPAQVIRFAMLGTLSRMKGASVLEALLSGVRRTDVEYHFYGRTEPAIERRLTALGLICHGNYVTADMPGILEQVDVGMVLPIWEDNGPQVAMEFVNNRIPVLGTRRGGIPDIVSPSAGFLFDPDDAGQLAAAIAWIEALTPAQLQAISSRMERLRTPEQHAARIFDLYSQTLAARAARVISR